MNSNNSEVDLFDHYEYLPKEVLAILFSFYKNGSGYEDCKNLVTELNKVGYTCEFGLDTEPFGLKKLTN